jgi:hypothetical protein
MDCDGSASLCRNEKMILHFPLKIPRYDRTLQGGTLSYNIFAIRHVELRDLASMVESEKSARLRATEWYREFNYSEVSAALQKDETKQNELGRELDRTRTKLVDQISIVEILKTTASLGWDPRYWFSADRSLKVLELKTQRMALAMLIEHQNRLKQQFDELQQDSKSRKGELKTYRAFNPLEAEAAIKALDTRLERIRQDLEYVELLSQKLDKQLKEPLAELAKFKQRKGELEIEIARAEEFENRLSAASNSYERRMIHEECANSFGHGRPISVIRNRQKEIEFVDRNIGKLDHRLKSIAIRAREW